MNDSFLRFEKVFAVISALSDKLFEYDFRYLVILLSKFSKL